MWPAPYRCRRWPGGHSGQQLLRGDGAVPGLRRRRAGVAVPARRTAMLAEVRSSWVRRHSTVSQRASIASRCCRAAGGAPRPRRSRRSSSAAGRRRPARRPARRSPGAVAAGAAGLLVVALHRLRQVQVRDEPDVGLVDAHAERDGGHHHQAGLAQEPRLVARRGPLASRPAWYGSAVIPLRQRNSRSPPPTCARGSRRCRRRRRARCAAGPAAGRAGCPWARSGTRCWAGRSWPRTGGRRAGRAGSTISSRGGSGRGRGQRDPRHARASARRSIAS